MYIQGLSTSLPEDVQIKMIRSVEGLENGDVVRGYAIEYEWSCHQLKNLETKLVQTFIHAGQMNGTSGYEEAGQGLYAGINAV